MKKIGLLFMLAIASLLIAQTVSVDSPMGSFKMTIEGVNNSSAEDAVSIVDAIAERLEVLEKNFHSKLNKLDQKRAENITNEIYELLALLPSDVYASVQAPVSSQSTKQKMDASMEMDFEQADFSEQQVEVEEKPMQLETQNSAMSEREFKQLYDNVEEESFADDQLSVVRIATRSKYFSVDQLTRLLDLFSFADDKIDCVQLVYPRVVDKDNAHNLLKAFTYSDDKKEVERIISR